MAHWAPHSVGQMGPVTGMGDATRSNTVTGKHMPLRPPRYQSKSPHCSRTAYPQAHQTHLTRKLPRPLNIKKASPLSQKI